MELRSACKALNETPQSATVDFDLNCILIAALREVYMSSIPILPVRMRVAFFAFALGVVSLQTTATEEARTVFPMSSYLDVVTIPVKIGSKEYQFVVDSGSAANVAHKTLLPLVGEFVRTQKGRGAGGESFHVDEHWPPTMQVGSMDLDNMGWIICYDMRILREATGRNIEGILGMPFFEKYIVQMNFDQNQLVILPTSIKPRAEWGTPIPTPYGLLNVELDEGLVVECRVDTGHTSALSLPPLTFEKLVHGDIIDSVEDMQVATANLLRITRNGRIDTVKVGGLENRNVSVSSGSKYGLMGLGYLRRYCVTFDLSRNRIYLAKRKRFDDLDRKSDIGIAMLRKFPIAILDQKIPKTIVSHVGPDSPAEKAGIRTDDEIIAVEGEDIAEKPIAEIRYLMRKHFYSNDTVAIKLLRDSEQKTISVTKCD